MFTSYHFAWLTICITAGLTLLYFLKKHRPSLQRVLSWVCVGCVISELVKTFSVLEMVPASDGTTMHLYLEMQHLPLHLCSIQIIFIFYARFAKDSKVKEALLAFMYPTCTIGAFLALMIPTIFPANVTVTEAFLKPLTYQFFLFHVMLVVLGIYIPMSAEVNIRPKHYLSTLGILGVLAFLSIYLNSIFAMPTYVDGELVSVDYSTNFFFTQDTPIGIALTEKWHWFLYLGIIVTIAVVFIGVFYLPYIMKARKEKAAA